MSNAQNFYERLKKLREEQTRSLQSVQQPLYLYASEDPEQPSPQPLEKSKVADSKTKEGYVDLDLAETYIDFDIS